MRIYKVVNTNVQAYMHIHFLYINKDVVSKSQAASLSIVSYIGCAISITCLVATISAILIFRYVHSWSYNVYIHVYVCIVERMPLKPNKT